MKWYKVINPIKQSIEQIASFEVCCNNENEARYTHPNKDIIYIDGEFKNKNERRICRCQLDEWVREDLLYMLVVKYISDAEETNKIIRNINFK
jgi:hypothetical protein